MSDARPSPLQDIPGFQQAIVRWFRQCGRDYPWRRTRDPYAILVSEMMLQQTQIATVLGKGYFSRWMERFPDPVSLAVASEAEVLRCWEGLGYYNRARNLQRAARQIVEKCGGIFPDDLDELSALPGIGRYTAGAMAAFAFDLPAPIVDANIARVLARLFRMQQPVDDPSGRKRLWHWAEQLVPRRNARLFNSGIMELGQQICLPRQPQCESCPVRSFCASCNRNPEALPKKHPRRAVEFLTEHAIFSLRGGRLLLRLGEGRRRGGLWRLPPREADFLTQANAPLLLQSQYTITHHRVALRVHALPAAHAEKGERWHALVDIPSVPMPAPYRRAVEVLLAGKS
jgi:A/G-specific adenine glycosylase